MEAKARYLGTRFRFSQRAGTYTMVLDSPGFKSVVRALELAPGESKVLDITLKPTWKPILLQKLFRAV